METRIWISDQMTRLDAGIRLRQERHRTLALSPKCSKTVAFSPPGPANSQTNSSRNNNRNSRRQVPCLVSQARLGLEVEVGTLLLFNWP